MTDSPPTQVDEPREAGLALRHEPKDVSARGIVLTAAGLLLTVIVAQLVSWWLFDYLNAQDRSSKPPAFPLAVQEQGRFPPEPQLEGMERLEGRKAAVRPSDLQASRQRLLETYGWVDRQAGIVRIPIDRAMKVIVEQNQQPPLPGAQKGDQP